MRPFLYAALAVLVLAAIAAPALILLAAAFGWLVVRWSSLQRAQEQRARELAAIRERRLEQQRIRAWLAL